LSNAAGIRRLAEIVAQLAAEYEVRAGWAGTMG
jgi:hypothetical protein